VKQLCRQHGCVYRFLHTCFRRFPMRTTRHQRRPAGARQDRGREAAHVAHSPDRGRAGPPIARGSEARAGRTRAAAGVQRGNRIGARNRPDEHSVAARGSRSSTTTARGPASRVDSRRQCARCRIALRSHPPWHGQQLVHDAREGAAGRGAIVRFSIQVDLIGNANYQLAPN
jgi:hypothetical protein